MSKMSAKMVQENLEGIIDQVLKDYDRVIITRKGKKVAAIIHIEDLKFLVEIEDRIDARLVEEALAEMKEKHLQPIPWEKVKKEIRKKDRSKR